MEMGMIGLGRMGGGMAQRLLNGGHRVVVYDPVKDAVEAMVKRGAIGAASLADLAGKLKSPRAVWLMVPSGEPTENTVNSLAAELSAGDIIIDGGNSNYKESMRRAAAAADRGIIFLDAGTSSGIWGLEEGYCLMVGGDLEAFRRLEPIFLIIPGSPQYHHQQDNDNDDEHADGNSNYEQQVEWFNNIEEPFLR